MSKLVRQSEEKYYQGLKATFNKGCTTLSLAKYRIIPTLHVRQKTFVYSYSVYKFE